MSMLSYKKAKEANAISEVNAERMLCLFLLNMDENKFANIDKAALELNTTPATIRVEVNKCLKKLRDSGYFIDGAETAGAAELGSTPRSTSKKAAGSKKRKTSDQAHEGTTEMTPSKKKAAGRRTSPKAYSVHGGGEAKIKSENRCDDAASDEV